MQYQPRGFYKGHALSETGVIAVTIAVACVVVMTTVQADMSNLMATIRGGVDNRASVAMAAASSQAAGLSSNITSTNGAGAIGAQDGGQDFSSSEAFGAFSITQAEVSSAIETTGANGATEMLAQSIQQMAEQMLEDGTIDPATANQLIALANQGYRLAEIQRLAEQAFQEGRADKPIVFEGRTFANANHLLCLVGLIVPGAPPSMSPQQAMSVYGTSAFDSSGWMLGPEINQFWSSFHQISQTSAFQSSPLAAQVTAAANNILNIGDAAESASYQGLHLTTSQFRSEIQAAAPSIPIQENELASDVTTKNSDTICKNGQGNSNSRHCQ